MLSYPGPTSNYQRQQQFCKRHPGYYRKYSAKRRALEKRTRENFPALWKSLQAKSEPLMLPAPVETIEIPGMTTIPTKHEMSLLDRLNAIPLNR